MLRPSQFHAIFNRKTTRHRIGDAGVNIIIARPRAKLCRVALKCRNGKLRTWKSGTKDIVCR